MYSCFFVCTIYVARAAVRVRSCVRADKNHRWPIKKRMPNPAFMHKQPYIYILSRRSWRFRCLGARCMLSRYICIYIILRNMQICWFVWWCACFAPNAYNDKRPVQCGAMAFMATSNGAVSRAIHIWVEQTLCWRIYHPADGLRTHPVALCADKAIFTSYANVHARSVQ